MSLDTKTLKDEAQRLIDIQSADPRMGALYRYEYLKVATPEAVLALIADLDEARNGMKHSCAIRLKKRIELLETQRDQLIADNERLTKAVGLQVIRRFVGDDDQKNIDELVAAGIQVDKELIVQLKAENERLGKERITEHQSLRSDRARNSLYMMIATSLIDDHPYERGGSDWDYEHPIHDKIISLLAERDQLRAEVAGLRTGYEAYERVNAELKAEVEGLRKLGPSKEIIWCACGDGYPVNSHGAGFMDANNGVCANCDAALGQGEKS